MEKPLLEETFSKQLRSPEAITQMVAVIATFGFLNRWNDTMATTLEEEPKIFATQHLAPIGWEAGKHH